MVCGQIEFSGSCTSIAKKDKEIEHQHMTSTTSPISKQSSEFIFDLFFRYPLISG